MNLSPEDREALAAALPAGLGPASLRYSPLMFKNRSTAVECLTGFGEMAMDAVTPAVEAIVARHVAAALTDLDARCVNAETELRALCQKADGEDFARLAGKKSGVALVRDYIRAAIPPP